MPQYVEARLLLSQPVQAAIELTAVLVEERPELGTGRLIDDILSECSWKGGHKRSISGAPPMRKVPLIGYFMPAGASPAAQGAVMPRIRASRRGALDLTVPSEQPSRPAASGSRRCYVLACAVWTPMPEFVQSE